MNKTIVCSKNREKKNSPIECGFGVVERMSGRMTGEKKTPVFNEGEEGKWKIGEEEQKDSGRNRSTRGVGEKGGEEKEEGQ